MNNNTQALQHVYAWAVHAFTASAAYIGLLTLFSIYEHDYLKALWLMAITVAIDAIDGTLARLVRVKEYLPSIDGALLDNIVDYLNYVITPCFFLYINTELLPTAYAAWIILFITITSSYQFCQMDAKTPDHFFKGFPCYWNFVVFYMFIFHTSPFINTLILLILCVMVFVPIKYVYPSRLDYLTHSKNLKTLMHGASLLYGASSALILWHYPDKHPLWVTISLGYVVMYLTISFYRTYFPIIIAKIALHRDDASHGSS